MYSYPASQDAKKLLEKLIVATIPIRGSRNNKFAFLDTVIVIFVI